MFRWQTGIGLSVVLLFLGLAFGANELLLNLPFFQPNLSGLVVYKEGIYSDRKIRVVEQFGADRVAIQRDEQPYTSAKRSQFFIKLEEPNRRIRQATVTQAFFEQVRIGQVMRRQYRSWHGTGGYYSYRDWDRTGRAHTQRLHSPTYSGK